MSRRGLPSPPAVTAPADKRFRRPDVRPNRHRGMARKVARMLRWGVPVVLALGGLAWGARQALWSPLLNIERIVVRGTVRMTPGDVEALLDGLRGQNMFRADFAHYQQRLLAARWISRATLSRVLPATVEVVIDERSPMAIARLGADLYVLDEAGVIIGEYGPEYADLDVPIVDGLISRGAGGPPVADPERARLTAECLAAFAARPDLRQHLSQIDVSSPRNVLVLLDDDPAWLHLGNGRFVDRMLGYIEIRPTLASQFPQIDYVDLRFGERVFVHSRKRPALAARATK